MKRVLQKMKKNNHTCIGSVGRSKGLNGEFYLNSFCNPKENIIDYIKDIVFLSDSKLEIEYIKKGANKLFSKIKQWFLDGPSPNDEPIKICSPYRKDQHPIAKGNKKPECVDKTKVFHGRINDNDYCCKVINPHNTKAANNPDITPEYPWGK